MTLQVINSQGQLKGPTSLYGRAATTVDIVSTAAETTLYSQTINGGDLGADKTLRLTLIGDFLHNNGAGDSMTLRLKFGGTTYLADACGFNAEANANRQPFKIVSFISNMGVTNSQFFQMETFMRRPGAGLDATTGIGGEQTAFTWMTLSNTATVDTTANQTLAFTGQWSASSASNSWRMRYGILELL
jgi:hypothetical protein